MKCAKNYEKLSHISKNQKGHLFELAGWQEAWGSLNSQHNQLSPLLDPDAVQAESSEWGTVVSAIAESVVDGMTPSPSLQWEVVNGISDNKKKNSKLYCDNIKPGL